MNGFKPKIAGGKRKVNKSLKAWVAFVKKVQKEEKLSYKDAIHRAKVRKDKGEKWMKGGDSTEENNNEYDFISNPSNENPVLESEYAQEDSQGSEGNYDDGMDGGRRRRRTMRRSRGRSRSRGRTARRARRRSSRRY